MKQLSIEIARKEKQIEDLQNETQEVASRLSGNEAVVRCPKFGECFGQTLTLVMML